MSAPTTQTLLASAIAGDRASLARLMSQIERDPQVEIQLRTALAGAEAKSVVIGITGPPGAGKSTLISALLSHTTASYDKTAVLAVDPSSPFSGGALLGDRVRMQSHGLGDRVFIRSMASKGESGGLARATATAIQLLEACGWPLILLETLGIGQVELDVMDLATVVAVVLNPGWGDIFQANKAGLTEAGDIFVINKADKDGTQKTRADLQDSLSLLQSPVPIQIFDTIAVKQEGVETLWQGIQRYLTEAKATGVIEQKRLTRRHRLLMRILQRDFDTRISAYWCSEHGNAQVLKALAGELSIEALRDDLFNQMTELD
jgi:LAO/AO transport system kinase